MAAARQEVVVGRQEVSLDFFLAKRDAAAVGGSRVDGKVRCFYAGCGRGAGE